MALNTDKVEEISEQYLPIQVQDKLGDLRESLGEADVVVRQFVKERPIATVLGALAVGYLFGRLIARR